MIRILLVDDEQLVRTGLRMRLSAEADMTVIGEAGDGPTALELAPAVGPDVVLMDVALPRMSGLAATLNLRTTCPNAAVVMLSIHDDDGTRAQARACGATAFVTKGGQMSELLAAIRQAAYAGKPPSAPLPPQPAGV
jgi:DNA-binding NarL/FixJ family response regulator